MVWLKVNLTTFKGFVLKNKITEIKVQVEHDELFATPKRNEIVSVSANDVINRIRNDSVLYVFGDKLALYNNFQKLVLIDEIFKELIILVKAKLIIDRL